MKASEATEAFGGDECTQQRRGFSCWWWVVETQPSVPALLGILVLKLAERSSGWCSWLFFCGKMTAYSLKSGGEPRDAFLRARDLAGILLPSTSKIRRQQWSDWVPQHCAQGGEEGSKTGRLGFFNVKMHFRIHLLTESSPHLWAFFPLPYYSLRFILGVSLSKE